MKKKIVLVVVAFLLVLQAQTVFAADTVRDFEKALDEGNFSKAERILKNSANKWSIKDQGMCWLIISFQNNSNALRAAQLLYQYRVNFGDETVGSFIASEKSEEVSRYLLSIGMPIGDIAIGWAINRGYTDNFVQLLLEKGGKLNAWGLRTAAEKKRWALFPDLIKISTEDNINYRQTRDEYTAWYNSQSESFRKVVSFKYEPKDSRTALMYASQYGQLRIVRLLVENGAKVNLRAEGGETAASLAYDNGEIEVYNYLKANGAIDFEPKQQVAQQPAAPAQSTTNVYVQPSTPAPSNSSNSSTPSKNIGKEIADAFKSPLQSGTYSLVGSQEKISLVGIAKSGVITQTWQGKSYQGTYNIDGNKMTVQIRGYTFVFNITSETSFSGHNETWVRTGF